MSAQIDIVPERRSQAKGPGSEGAAATFDDRYRFSARSANLICRIARHVADELKTEVKNPWQAYSFGVQRSWRSIARRHGVSPFQCTNFLEITRIDTQNKITVYKKVIMFSKTEGIL
jgi:hypothetical protein